MTKIFAVYSTDEQKANLTKLANYLEALPEDYNEFSMEQFYYGSDENTDQMEEAYVKGGLEVSCGTVACAVGHGPAAGIPFGEDDWWTSSCTGFTQPDWGCYSARFVDPGVGFDWMFAGTWTYHDDHHYGAAARIRFFLAHGGVPYDFNTYDIDQVPNHGKKIINLYEPYRKK